MKTTLLSLFLLVGMLSNAQETVEKTVGEFTTLKAYDLINVKMKKGETNRVVISGDKRDDVEVINRNGKLKIRMNLQDVYTGEDTVVVLYYTGVDVVDANEGANIQIEDPIEQFEIDLKAQEGGEITAEINTKYANIRAVTGGIINATGTAKNQDVSLYTGGIYNAKDLVTERTEVSVNAAGEAYIHATESVDVRIRAGGDVYIYGNPTKVDESRVFGGRIKRM